MRSKIQQIFDSGWDSYTSSFQPSVVQGKLHIPLPPAKVALLAATFPSVKIVGVVEIHNNSCRNRNCPNCQAVLKEIGSH